MIKIFILILFLFSIALGKSYSQEDWKIYNGCKDKINKNISNDFDKNACKKTLEDKEALKRYGAENIYNEWIKKLYYFK